MPEKIRRKFFPPATLIYWIGFTALALVFMALFRAAFLLRHWSLAKEVPFGDIANAFLHGLRFDIAIIATVVLPCLVLSFLPLIGFEYSRVSRRIVQVFLYVVFAFAFLLALIDIEYYSVFGDHLGVWFYTYLDRPSEVWYEVSGQYPVLLYTLIWGLVIAVFILIASKLNSVFQKRSGTSWISRTIYALLSIAFLIIGLRGGVALAPIDWGSAFFSSYGFANDLSLNGMFTLSRSLYETYDEDKNQSLSKYKFMSEDEALRTAQREIVTPADSLIDPERSLKRMTRFMGSDTTKQNVVIIILESWSARFVGALGGRKDITPYFDSLAQKSILFSNFYASGLRTNRGLLAVLCSFPSVPGRTVMKRYDAPHPFSSIAGILGERGYDSYFLYGGDLDFDNMGGFFRNEGFKHFVGEGDFPVTARLNKWGVPDHTVMEKANEMFASTNGKPFLGVIVTLSNHEPFKVPGKEFEFMPIRKEYDDYLNTFHYSDWSLGHFFHLAEKEAYFKNTIFVLVGDHGKILYHPDDMLHNFRIASLIYCPGRPDLIPRRIDAICGQVDLLPTVLSLLGVQVDHESWGRNVLALGSDSDGFAILNKDDGYAWVQDSLMLIEKPGSPAHLYRYEIDSLGVNDVSGSFPNEFESMRQHGRALFQVEIEMARQGVLPRFDSSGISR